MQTTSLRRLPQTGALLTAVLVPVVIGLRLAFPPQVKANGQSSVSYILIGALALMLLVLFGLFGKNRGEIRLTSRLVVPPACLGVLFGVTLLLSTLYDIYVFVSQDGKTPPPGEELTGSIDGLLLICMFIFGVLGGLFVIHLSLRWLAGRGTQNTGMSYLALTPVLWMWMRLARYNLSYASAVDISKSFYDFVMFIFTLLFLMSFARFAAGLGSPKRLTFYAAGAALFGLSGPATHYLFQLVGNSRAYKATQLATITDFTLGLFALCLMFVLAFGKPEEDLPEPAQDTTPEPLAPSAPPAELAQPAEPAQPEPTAEPQPAQPALEDTQGAASDALPE